MHLQTIDLAVLAIYVAFAIGVGLYFRQRASKDPDQFFLAGRKLPWWMVGTSMVATTFAADTPLVITGWVRDFGIWRNWLWWCFAVGGMLTVFLFSRYWRRLGVMTQAEFAEMRYGGSGAAALRASLGFFHAFLTNPIVLCWVLLAAAKISDVLFDIDKTTSLGIACAICLSYSLMSGFWGVAVTDLVQFCLAMIGAIALAFIAWDAVGGPAGDPREALGSRWRIGRDPRLPALSGGRLLARSVVLDHAGGGGGGVSGSFLVGDLGNRWRHRRRAADRRQQVTGSRLHRDALVQHR